MVSFLSSLQGPIQAALRPAVWLPGIRSLHRHREKWVCSETVAEECVAKVIKAVDTVQLLDPKSTYQVHKVDEEHYFVEIFNYTWAEWLDVVEIEFRPGRESGSEAKCYSFSSGFLPTWVPFAFIFNCIFFFVPFYDNKFNSRRLARLREAMELPCKVVPGND
ncbi:uncharacterized protein [Antedon mediterranea]|uniref:uncharacterized protein n=1 Tax=Antedon mediterranea TaxID=105859 RepID=UPI003AF88676